MGQAEVIIGETFQRLKDVLIRRQTGWDLGYVRHWIGIPVLARSLEWRVENGQQRAPGVAADVKWKSAVRLFNVSDRQHRTPRGFIKSRTICLRDSHRVTLAVSHSVPVRSPPLGPLRFGEKETHDGKDCDSTNVQLHAYTCRKLSYIMDNQSNITSRRFRFDRSGTLMAR